MTSSFQPDPTRPPTTITEPAGDIPQKPGAVVAIGVLCLVSGIIDCVGFLTILACWPFGIYSLVVGIFELIYASKLLPDPIRTSKMNKTIAVLQIINILNFELVALATGIISLVFYSDLKVQQYFGRMRAAGVPG